MSDIVYYVILSVCTSIFASIFSLLFLSGYQKREEAGISVKDYYFTVKKIRFFTLALLLSALGGFLQGLYGSSRIDVIGMIFIMNILPFLAWIDKKERIVPNSYLIRMLVVSVIYILAKIFVGLVSGSGVLSVISSALLGIAIMFIPMYLGHLISRGGVGAGDVKLLAVIGIFLGFRSSYMLLMVAFIVAAVFCLVQLIRKRITMKSHMPFVPFIAIGMFLMVYLGI